MDCYHRECPGQLEPDGDPEEQRLIQEAGNAHEQAVLKEFRRRGVGHEAGALIQALLRHLAVRLLGVGRVANGPTARRSLSALEPRRLSPSAQAPQKPKS